MGDIIERPTVESLLKTLNGNALALDIAKNHTGICMWYNNILYTLGFDLPDYDILDIHAEFNMRLNFKQKLITILNNRSFDYIIVEDVYGGQNFDTTRKLLALQTVIDELLYEGVVTCKNFYRWIQPQWAKRARLILHQKGKLTSKFETQGLLEFLNFDFYLQNKDKSEADKRKIFFEDICDACGMLMAVVAEVNFNNTQEIKIKQSDIVVKYIQSEENIKSLKDKVIKEAFASNAVKKVEIDKKRIEKDIYNKMVADTDAVMMAEMPSTHLGNYGLKKKFTFFPKGGLLIFYYRKAHI